MPDDAASVAAVIVNFRQEGYLPALFESLSNQTLAPSSVVLVNSERTEFTPPQGTHVIDMARNMGYAAALNLGIDWAMRHGAGSVMLLNADTKLDRECLKTLTETGGDIVQPLVLLMRDPDRINVAGLKPTFLGVAYCMGYRKPRGWAGTSVREIPAASGSAMLVRRQVFDRIGAFDEEYFMYLEDLDFSLRAKNAGFIVVLNPGAIAWHEYRLRLGPKKLFRLFDGSKKIRRLLRS